MCEQIIILNNNNNNNNNIDNDDARAVNTLCRMKRSTDQAFCRSCKRTKTPHWRLKVWHPRLRPVLLCNSCGLRSARDISRYCITCKNVGFAPSQQQQHQQQQMQQCSSCKHYWHHPNCGCVCKFL